MELTIDQKQAVDTVLDWYRAKESSYITLGGFAGTGKTTVISIIREKLEKEKVKKVAFCAYTGKAVRVLESKLKEQKAIYPKDSISTIHSLIYTAVFDDAHQIVGWEQKEKVDADLIIIDEASMVNRNIWEDLQKYGIRILAVGDHGQLPPISGNFGLMKKPMILLKQIHRQAQGNPIIKLSQMARLDGHVPIGIYGNGIRKIDKHGMDINTDLEDELMSYSPDTMILCGYNRTRLQLNQQIRSYLGFESQYLEPGERVICLKNDHINNLTNGMLGVIKTIRDEGEHHYFAEVEIEGQERPYKGILLRAQVDSPNPITNVPGLHPTKFGGRFDRGYAITVHKSQGSQARKVILFEERFPKMTDTDWRRWLYTGITRAEEELTIIGK